MVNATGGLRDRKKAMVREALQRNAERLFEERGYDDVTVAEIADAANVSVKTLFSYFRSKEDLAFADTSELDQVARMVRDCPGDGSPAQVIATWLTGSLDEPPTMRGIEGFHRRVGDSDALRSRLLRIWAGFEDQVTEALAARLGVEPSPPLRLQAIALVGMVRSLTSPEVRRLVAGLTPKEAEPVLARWIAAAAAQVEAARDATG